MSTNKSAKHIAAKIVALLTSDYSARITIVAVHEVDYGQQVVLLDEANDEEFVVTVQKRTNGPAIVASTGDALAENKRPSFTDPVWTKDPAGDVDDVVEEEEPF